MTQFEQYITKKRERETINSVFIKQHSRVCHTMLITRVRLNTCICKPCVIKDILSQHWPIDERSCGYVDCLSIYGQKPHLFNERINIIAFGGWEIWRDLLTVREGYRFVITSFLSLQINK